MNISKLTKNVNQWCMRPQTSHPAIPCGQKVNGKKFFTFTVKVSVTRDIFESPVVELRKVIAPSQGEALSYVKDEILRFFGQHPEHLHPFELVTWGPKGGSTRRFTGWEGCVGGAMVHSILEPKLLKA